MDARKVKLLGALCATGLVFALAPATASALCFGQAATITGTGAGETIPGTAGADVIEAGGGDDIVNGGGGADRICGEGGDDTINGQGDNDQMDGGTSVATGDTVTFVDLIGSQGPSFTVDLVAGTASGQPPITTTDSLTNFENVIGSATFDFLLGDAGVNRLDGFLSPDGLTGRGGNDILSDLSDSGADQDGALYPDATGGIQANETLGTVVTPNVGTDTLAGVPHVTGTSFDDTFVGSAAQDFFVGAGGNDQFSQLGNGDDFVEGGSGGADRVSYASQTAIQMDLSDTIPPNTTLTGSNDTVQNIEHVIGSPETDTITGSNTASETIDGLGGDDIMSGGTGITPDTASFATQAIAVQANLSNSNSMGQGNDFLGNFENLTGSSEDDLLAGDNPANNVLNGGSAGFDTVSYYDFSLAVNANLDTGDASGQGADQLLNIDALTGSIMNDTLVGDSNQNTLRGQEGDDTIIDTDSGGSPVDTLVLGPGLDVLTSNDGFSDSVSCAGGGPDSGTVDTNPAENYVDDCSSDGDAVVDFLDVCPTTAGTGLDGCVATDTPMTPLTPATSAPPGPTGQRAAALKKCKKKRGKARKRCVKRAKRLPE
jgi:Ca2+-binding RTX toxin-like protein